MYNVFISDKTIKITPEDYLTENPTWDWSVNYRKYNNSPVDVSQLKSILLAYTHLRWNLTLVTDII